MTDDHAWVNDDLAAIYGVAAPGTSTLTRVQLDPSQRSGILTNAGLMAAFAHQTADSPVLRGVFVLRNVMCKDLPPPPPGVNTSPPASSGGAMTTRQEFATQHEQGSCASCHHTIDGIGFGFEHYDAVGAWRTQDDGLPVDSSGWFTGDYDSSLTGTFDGAVELGQKLAQSPTAQACLAKNWLRYALGVDHTGIDTKGLTPIVDAFSAAQLDMHALVIAVTTSDAFLTRVISTGGTP
jgi:hypothetical protein